MFNTEEIQILMDILTNVVGISVEEGEIVMQHLHPYSQQFSTANNYFVQLCDQLLSMVDLDDALQWIQTTLTEHEDDISTDGEYYSSDSEDDNGYDDYDDY
jgi:asparagine N-glycosylation enzyme membrane subunit Stt3